MIYNSDRKGVKPLLEIGERIKIQREKLKMSQDELAKRIGYKSRSSINKIELGHYNLTQSKIKAIADALETTPAYIMGWEELDESVDLEALRKQVKQAGVLSDLIVSQYGEAADEALSMFVLLDAGDQGEIRGEMKQMLKAPKYNLEL